MYLTIMIYCKYFSKLYSLYISANSYMCVQTNQEIHFSQVGVQILLPYKFLNIFM